MSNESDNNCLTFLLLKARPAFLVDLAAGLILFSSPVLPEAAALVLGLRLCRRAELETVEGGKEAFERLERARLRVRN